MSGSLREILPRQQLRVNDRTPGSYPTTARTGDRTRTGKNNVFFDDLNTIFFVRTGSIVSFPTTLPLTSQFLKSDMTSSITAAYGDIDKNAIENWVFLPPQQEPFFPFVESKLPEQNLDKTGSFYLTGSDYNQVGLGFNSPLGSKTIIRIAIPVTQNVPLPSTVASVFYFNAALGRFEEVGIGRKLAPTPSSYPLEDVMLFGPFGNNTFGGDFSRIPVFNSQNVGTRLPFVLGLAPTDMAVPSALADNVFAPTASHLIDMSKYISDAFLLEKAIIEVPLAAGPGWFNDTTQFRSVSNNTDSWYDDGGGPCVVFSLLNNLIDRRDLILSATVIPAGDNTKNFRVDPIADTANVAGFDGGTIFLRSFNGFSAVATPTAVLQSGTNGTFTGSVKMNVLPVVSNGVITSKSFINQITQNASFLSSYLVLANVFGRSAYPSQPSGRSYFGKEYTIPSTFQTVSDIKRLYGAPNPGVYDYPDSYFYEQSQVSPYVLLPTDKIVFCASKHRPIQANAGNNTFFPSLRHDIVLTSGSIYITMYGSLISNGIEHHDTLNSRLETNEVHETIGFEPYTDKFQVEYFQSFSGSMISQQLTGSIIMASSAAAGVYTSGNRYVWADAANTSSFQQRLEVVEQANGAANYSDINTLKKERFSLLKSSQMFSSNERFYDSLIPQLEDIFTIDNTQIYGVQYVFNPCSPKPYNIDLPSIFINFDFIPYPIDPNVPQEYKFSNVDWTKSFPFEPKYATARRILDVSQILSKNTFLYLCGTGSMVPSEYRAQSRFCAHTLNYQWGGDSTAFFSSSLNSIRIDAFTKLVYGFGDNNSYPTMNQQAAIMSSCNASLPANFAMYGSTQAPMPRAIVQYGGMARSVVSPCPRSNTYRGAIIRGWKYGLINGLPQYSKSIFNNRSFGQPRDMLEQRLDTKFYEALGFTQKGIKGGSVGGLPGPVQIKYVNQRGEQTRPEFTFSSNLSVEATSSLPYFDGVVRNREEPLNLPSLGLTVVT